MPEKLFTEFPTLEGDFYTPQGLYQEIFPRFSNPRNEVYWGGPASSGAAIRLIDQGKPVDLQRSLLVIGLNSILAGRLAESAVGLFDKQNLTLAHKVGKSLEPKEFAFNLFWQFYLTGVPPWFADQFAQIAERPEIVSQINDHNAQNRELAYIRLSDLFFNMIAEVSDVTLNPVSAVVFLPDHRTSLGCRLERRTIIKLREFGFNISMYEAVINLASSESARPNNALLTEVYSYIQFHGQTRLNDVSFTPPFVNKSESASLVELIPLDENETSHQEPLFYVKQGVALRIAALRENLKAINNFESAAADFSTGITIKVNGGRITIGGYEFEPENLTAAVLEATIIDGKAVIHYPCIRSGGMKITTYTFAKEDIDRLLSVCL